METKSNDMTIQAQLLNDALRISAIEYVVKSFGLNILITVLDTEGDKETIELWQIEHEDFNQWLDEEGYLKGDETTHGIVAGKDTTVHHHWEHSYVDFIRLHLTADIVYDYLIAKNLTTLEFIEE